MVPAGAWGRGSSPPARRPPPGPARGPVRLSTVSDPRFIAGKRPSDFGDGPAGTAHPSTVRLSGLPYRTPGLSGSGRRGWGS
eukprot:747096-Hanusia_phi.AAC.7